VVRTLPFHFQGAQVWPLVRELRSPELCTTAKNKQTNKKKKNEGKKNKNPDKLQCHAKPHQSEAKGKISNGDPIFKMLIFWS